jgi:hypothetical protein
VKTTPCCRPGCTNQRTVPDWYSGAPTYCQGPGNCARIDSDRVHGRLRTVARAIPAAVREAEAQIRLLKTKIRPTTGSIRYDPKEGTMTATSITEPLNLKDFRELDKAMEECATSYHAPLPYHMGTIRSRFEWFLSWSDNQPKSIRNALRDDLANAYERDLARESAKWLAEDWAIEGSVRNGRR